MLTLISFSGLISISRAERLLNLIEDNSELEDLSDADSPDKRLTDQDYTPPNFLEQNSDGDSDSALRLDKHVQGSRRLVHKSVLGVNSQQLWKVVKMMTVTMQDLEDVCLNVSVLTLMSIHQTVMALRRLGQNLAKMDLTSSDRNLVKENMNEDVNRAGMQYILSRLDSIPFFFLEHILKQCLLQA